MYSTRTGNMCTGTCVHMYGTCVAHIGTTYVHVRTTRVHTYSYCSIRVYTYECKPVMYVVNYTYIHTSTFIHITHKLIFTRTVNINYFNINIYILISTYYVMCYIHTYLTT